MSPFVSRITYRALSDRERAGALPLLLRRAPSVRHMTHRLLGHMTEARVLRRGRRRNVVVHGGDGRHGVVHVLMVAPVVVSGQRRRAVRRRRHVTDHVVVERRGRDPSAVHLR